MRGEWSECASEWTNQMALLKISYLSVGANERLAVNPYTDFLISSNKFSHRSFLLSQFNAMLICHFPPFSVLYCISFASHRTELLSFVRNVQFCLVPQFHFLFARSRAPIFFSYLVPELFILPATLLIGKLHLCRNKRVRSTN